MKQRNVPRWKRVLSKMALNLGVVIGKFNGSANGAAIVDLPKSQKSTRQKTRRKRTRR